MTFPGRGAARKMGERHAVLLAHHRAVHEHDMERSLFPLFGNDLLAALLCLLSSCRQHAMQCSLDARYKIPFLSPYPSIHFNILCPPDPGPRIITVYNNECPVYQNPRSFNPPGIRTAGPASPVGGCGVGLTGTCPCSALSSSPLVRGPSTGVAPAKESTGWSGDG